MKRLISIFLVLTMLLTLAPMSIFAAENVAFSDVKDTDYYAQAADALVQLGVLTGYPDGTFGAEKSITRAEMAAIVCRMIGKEDDAIAATGETEFDDVLATDWASGYINVASEEGIINGDGTGNFNPTDDVKYEEAIKMVVCALGYGDDVEVDSNDWSKGYIEVADEKGISANLKGKKGEASTRGDVAVMSYNGLASDLTAPKASLKAGDYPGERSVKLSTATEDAEIYYTLDGSNPSTNSTKYTKSIYITKDCTLKAIAVKDGVLVSDVMTNKYTITGAMGGSSRPSAPAVTTYTVTFDLNYEGATGAPEAQDVGKGEVAIEPEAPRREGYAFVGWYEDNTYKILFDFSKEIGTPVTLVARWIDMTDTTDTDDDGLTDSLEEFYETDKNKSDTDGDSLSDYVEIAIFEYNPNDVDTDKNGISDGDEDPDNDGLSNKEEMTSETNPFKADSDEDGLSDKDEIKTYHTSPTKEDTDGDGASDGLEMEMGTDPLTTQSSFEVSKTSETEDSVEVSVDIELSGEQIKTLSVDKVESQVLFPEDMPGYLGGAYDFQVEGEFDTATINFEFDESLTANSDVEPVIYYFNEEKQELEALETTVSGNVASAQVEHFSTYILVNRRIYEKSFMWTDVWSNDINYSGVEIVLVIDDSGSMGSNDKYNQRLIVARDLIDKLPKDSKIGIVRFESGTSKLTPTLVSDKENAKSYLTASYFSSSGGTKMYTAINDAFSLFEATDNVSVLKIMVVLSDGVTNDSSKHSQVVNTANENNVKIYTVGLGNSTSYFNSYLKPLAVNTAAAFYLASDASQLTDIYKDISQRIDIETDSDNDGIPDYYEDNMIVFNGVKLVLDKNNPDTDGDGISDGEELTLEYKYNDDKTKVIVTGKLKSSPIIVDSDNDGLVDTNDIWALKATTGYITQEEINKFKNNTIAPMAYTYMMKMTYDSLLYYWDQDKLNEIHRRFDEFRYNNYKSSNGYIIVHPDGQRVNVDAGILYMPTMITEEPTEAQHYFRNELNVKYDWQDFCTIQYQIEIQKSSGGLKGIERWNDNISAKFHQNHKINGVDNRKFVSGCGYFELMYNHADDLLTEKNNPCDMGTFNYAPSDGCNPVSGFLLCQVCKKHDSMDVVPWGGKDRGFELIEGGGPLNGTEGGYANVPNQEQVCPYCNQN